MAAWPALHQSIRHVESFTGMLFAWFLGLMIAFCVTAAWFNVPPNIPLLVVTALIAVLLLRVELSMFVATWKVVGRGETFAIDAALSSPIWPTFVRPLVALWWTAHFLFGVFAAFMIEAQHYAPPAKSGTGMEEPLPLAAVLIAGFGLTFAGNIFLMFAAAALTRQRQTLERVWSLRVPVDIAVTALSITAALAGRF
jgi:hypothetical protein